jgi:hypothetical protein
VFNDSSKVAVEYKGKEWGRFRHSPTPQGRPVRRAMRHRLAHLKDPAPRP